SENKMTITDLQLECSKAATIIRRFRSQEDVRMGIPPQVLAEAKGIAVLSVFKMGFGFSGRGGSGVLFSRLPDGSWSAPVAITTGGFGIGHQIGVEVTDFVIVLNTVEAVNSVAQKRSVTLGGNLSVAVGPLGRNVEAGVAASKTLSPIYSYSMTKGLFLGASFEFSAFNTRDEVNTQWYGNGLFAKEILEGFVARPVEAEELYITLDATIG
ncbi:hypothetical protein BC830DRAFT_1053681, partial [Chytriomyces sp. MP71]